MNTSAGAGFVASQYNFHIPLTDGALLYNANSGAVLRFGDRDAPLLAVYLSSACNPFEKEAVPKAVFEQLLGGHFIVSAATDELAQIRERYHKARKDTPMVLTLTTTMDCNLGCYYCYEARSSTKLAIRDIDAITALVEDRLESSGKRALHVDWYGGEPLMNIEFMDAAAIALQELCASKQVTYSASIISNGTLWPTDVGGFITRHKVSQVQISFDGLRQNHDRRRRYRKGYVKGNSNSSFDVAVRLVDELLNYVRVDVRINIDRGNQHDVLPFIGFARSRGWFKHRFPAVVQPAKLASYSERSAFLRKHELSIDDYDKIRAAVRAECGSETRVEESESPNGFPMPRTSVCAALANDSIVIGSDRRQYRCGLQVSESHRAVGHLHDRDDGSKHQGDGSDASWWNQFDPTTLSKCSRCSFLPICWSGCPKKHLEMDEAAIAEQGAYWRNNLPRLVAAKAGVEVPDSFMFSESDQFRL